jgi:Skp family chaperone for outer membrane proteins
MKCASLIAIVLALQLAQNVVAAPTVTAFDGTWSIALNAHEYKNPDGSMTLPSVRYFRAKIRDGVLHGEILVKGEPNWYALDGKIATNGMANLRASGLTGKNPAYSSLKLRPNLPYQYEVMASFDNRHGTGYSVNNPPGRPRVRIFTFVKDTVADVYRHVADLLVAQGMFAESEQVLHSLKQKEYHNFLPGDSPDAVMDQAPQTAYDQKWEDRFKAIHDQLAAIGQEYSALVKKAPRTDEENQRLSVLQSDLATAQQALQQFYREIAMIGSPERANALQESGEALMQNLPTIDPGAVVIETVALPDKYRVILTTPDVQIPAEYAISREELRKKAFAFREAIDSRAPESEIKSLANGLYQILIGPIEKNPESYRLKT